MAHPIYNITLLHAYVTKVSLVVYMALRLIIVVLLVRIVSIIDRCVAIEECLGG